MYKGLKYLFFLLCLGIQLTGCKPAKVDFAALAREAEAKGNMAEAIQGYERAVREQPGELALRDRLVELLLKESRDEQALPHLMLLVGQRRQDEGLLVRTMELMLQFGGWKEAKEIYDAAPLEVKNQPAVRVIHAELLIREARFEEAFAELAALIEGAGTPAETVRSARLRHGRLQHQMGRSEAAMKEFETLLEKDPKDRDALLLRANLYMAGRKYPEAQNAYETLLAAHPDEHEAWLGLASLAVQEQRIQEAIVSYEKALAINPKDSDILFWLAELHFEQGDKAALAALKDKAQGRQWEREIFEGYLRGLERMGAEDHAAALKEFERLQSVLTGYPGLFDKIGLCHLKLGNPNQAEVAFAKLPHDEAMQEQVWSALGRGYLSITNYARAVRWLEVAKGRDRIGPLAQAQFGLGDMGAAHQNALLWLKEEPGSVAASLIAAETARRLELEDLGRTHFERIAAAEPDSVPGVYARAHLLVADKRLAEAAALLRSRPEMVTAQPGPRLLLAEIFLRLRQFDEADGLLRQTLEQDPRNSRAHSLSGVLAQVRGDVPAAFRSFSAALASDALDRAALTGLGSLMMEEENYASAAGYFERAAHLSRPEPDAALLWSLAEFARADLKRALLAAERAVKLAPTNAFARYLEVRGNIANAEWPRARQNAAELSRLHPAYAPGEHARALLALSTNGLPQALEHVSKGLQLQATNLLLQPLEVELLRATGQTGRARERLERLKRDFPQEPDRYLAEISLLFEARDYETARRLTLEGLKVVPRDPRLQQRLLDTFVLAGHEKEAAPVMEEVLKGDPGNAALQFMCGRLREAREDWPAAEEHYRGVLQTEPQNIATLNNLSLLVFRDPKRLDEAIKLAQRAYVLDGRNAAVADTLATLQLAKGDARQAVTLLETASRLAPRNVEIRLHLVEARLVQGYRAEARKEMEALTREIPEAAKHPRYESVSAKLTSSEGGAPAKSN